MDRNITENKYALACLMLEFMIQTAEQELKSEISLATLKRILKITEENT